MKQVLYIIHGLLLCKLYHKGDTTSITTSSAITTDTTSDPRGISRWDKVGKLAEALVELTGLAVSAAQAERIKALCDALDYYDKKAIKVRLRSQQPQLRGRLCSQKRTGHTTKEQMKRLF